MKSLDRERDRAELLRRMEHLQADTPARWGRMSAAQMVCHLADAFRMALGEQAVTDVSRLRDRTFIKVIALYLPAPWPPGIQTVREIDQGAGGGTCPGDFAGDVAAVGDLMQRVAGPRAAWPRHPIFGRMSRRAWLRWGYLHVDHHLRQFGG